MRPVIESLVLSALKVLWRRYSSLIHLSASLGAQKDSPRSINTAEPLLKEIAAIIIGRYDCKILNVSITDVIYMYIMYMISQFSLIYLIICILNFISHLFVSDISKIAGN